MRIVGDRGACQGHGQCVFVAPELFELDAEGRVHVRVAEPTSAQLELARDAEDVCPVQALRIED